jgi:putative transposase
VRQSEVQVVSKYIANQKEHHNKRSFKDEYRDVLKEHGVEFDEKYVWD